MGGKLTDTDKGYAGMVREFKRLAKGRHVVIGIRGDKGAVKEEGAELTVVEYAAVNEFGSDDGRVPERSFMRSTFDEGKAKYTAELKRGVGSLLDGNGTLDAVLGRLGLRVQGDIQKKLATGEGLPPPNAAATIARKGSSHTLIDSGRMRQSIDFEVRNRK